MADKDLVNEKYFKENNDINFISASEIDINNITQNQYNILTNGKPTLIKGVLSVGGVNRNNLFLFPGSFANSQDEIKQYAGLYVYGTNDGHVKSVLTYYRIRFYNNSIHLEVDFNGYFELYNKSSSSSIFAGSVKAGGITIANKKFPSYPSSPERPQSLIYTSNNTLSWGGEVVPQLPEDASENTYVLKAINGVLTWVKE